MLQDEHSALLTSALPSTAQQWLCLHPGYVVVCMARRRASARLLGAPLGHGREPERHAGMHSKISHSNGHDVAGNTTQHEP